MRIYSILSIAVTILLGCTAASSQSIFDHPAPWLNERGTVTFLRVDSSGTTLLVNRRSLDGVEELVTVPVAGGTTRVLHTDRGHRIHERIAISGDGQTVAFARRSESRVYVIASPGVAVAVADVSPDRDPRDLALSADGRWLAFTAAGTEGGAQMGRLRANLYVAATDGSVIRRITNTSVVGREIPFDFSADGSTIVWVDDRMKGPMVANRDGSAATRLASTEGRTTRVFCAPNGSKIYLSTVTPSEVRLQSMARSGTSWSLDHKAPSGTFVLAPGSGAIRLVQAPSKARTGTCWSVTGSATRASLFPVGTPPYAGSMAASADGSVVVWRAGRHTRVWKRN